MADELLEELELNGRRLVVLPAVRREDVEKAKTANKVRQTEQDRKSLHLLKEGLTNIQDFVVQGVADADMKKRLKYASDKEDHLKKNPNYIVSRTSTPNKMKTFIRIEGSKPAKTRVHCRSAEGALHQLYPGARKDTSEGPAQKAYRRQVHQAGTLANYR